MRTILAALMVLVATGPLAALSHLELRDGRPVVLPQEFVPPSFPGAAWRLVSMRGKPVMEARRDGQPVGYLFLTQHLDDMVGYSGKPIEILVALTAKGVIERVDLIAHHEPILLIGIPEQVIHDFLDQFEGRGIAELLRDNASGQSRISLDGISGATVTALVSEQVVFTGARIVAQEVGVLAQGSQQQVRLSDAYQPMTWAQLIDAGLLRHVALSAAEVRGPQHAGEDDWLDLYYGVLNQPSLGINLLGEEAYRALVAEHPGKALLILLNNGSYSFRGSGFVRGGIFDRLQLTQGLELIRFRDRDYIYQFRLHQADAPHIKEKAIYVVPSDAFNAAAPWEMEVLVSERLMTTAKSKRFLHVKAPFEMPAAYVVALPSAFGQLLAGSVAGRVWAQKKVWVGLYLGLWLVVVATFVQRERISKDRKVLERFHLVVLACSILLLGIGQKGQPSVVNIFTFIDVLRSGSGPALFLSEPFLFVSWIMITVATVLWGRGPFCGWICPYGGMLEILNWLRNRVIPRRWHRFYELPDAWHDRLKWLPYLIFVGLLTVSLFSLNLAETLAEIEPFKTTWLVGVTNRPWYLALYWVWLLIMGLVTVRFFCRYLCPLGAYIAILARFQVFRLPRRNFCSVCKICAKGCATRAIDERGVIDPKTCFGCLECTNQMNDEALCPPLVKPELWEKYERSAQRRRSAS